MFGILGLMSHQLIYLSSYLTPLSIYSSIYLSTPLSIHLPLFSQIAPEGINVWNPGFDVTPAYLITGGIITEKGVIRQTRRTPTGWWVISYLTLYLSIYLFICFYPIYLSTYLPIYSVRLLQGKGEEGEKQKKRMSILMSKVSYRRKEEEAG